MHKMKNYWLQKQAGYKFTPGLLKVNNELAKNMGRSVRGLI
jgi:hypothetical protein